MIPVLPKPSRGYLFERLLAIELNDFDVQRLLPSLFYLVVTRGRQYGGKPNDPKRFDEYLERLANHARVIGFDDPVGQRLLDRWIRASVVQMGRAGRAKVEEQIEFVLPLTLLAYKPGFPVGSTRQRNVHLFLYRILIDVLRRLDAMPSPEAALAAIFTSAFGKGVQIGGAPKYDGSYDGETAVDIHTFLALAYLDGFQASEASKKASTSTGGFGPALPRVAHQMATDVIAYVLAYQDRMPVLALTRGLMALVNFELFVYTSKLTYAVNSLVASRHMPAAGESNNEASPPQLYVDFTRVRGGISDTMARACVDRDLEELRSFVDSILFLRTMDRFVQLQPHLQDRLTLLATPAYLEGLVKLREDPGITARAQAEVESIQFETLAACQTDGQKEEAKELFDAEQKYSQGNSLDFALRLITLAQSKRAVQNSVAWFWSTGGLRETHGLLAGNLSGRRNWRYAMSDDLLSTLVQLALISNTTGDLNGVQVSSRLPLGHLLEFLERRFGVLVDRPPALLDSAEARAASSQNVEALKKRLRQMGTFEALSDDFNAQYLRAPVLGKQNE